MTEVFSTFDVNNYEWDTLPVETNNPRPPSRSYCFIWMEECGVKNNPKWDKQKGRTDDRHYFCKKAEKDQRKTLLYPYFFVGQKESKREKARLYHN